MAMPPALDPATLGAVNARAEDELAESRLAKGPAPPLMERVLRLQHEA
jgi:hypothetical protein